MKEICRPEHESSEKREKMSARTISAVFAAEPGRPQAAAAEGLKSKNNGKNCGQEGSAGLFRALSHCQ